MSPIKVMIVDDSAVVRQVLVELLGDDPGIEVIAAVADPFFAMQRMKTQWPDVILLDVEMPRMDGVTFLRKLMQERPTPVVICSTLTEAGAPTTIEALAAGAVTVITKPKIGLKQFLNEAAQELSGGGSCGGAGERQARRSRVDGAGPRSETEEYGGCDSGACRGSGDDPHYGARGRHRQLHGGNPGLSGCVDGAPGGLSRHRDRAAHATAFHGCVRRPLDGMCHITVKEAQHNDRVVPGLRPDCAGRQACVAQRSGAQYFVEVRDGPPVIVTGRPWMSCSGLPPRLLGPNAPWDHHDRDGR